MNKVEVPAGTNLPRSTGMRLDWVDAAKGIGIVLVLLGHGRSIGATTFSAAVYTFHMPLFFFLSGLLQNREKLTGSLKSFTASHARARLIPYLTFGILVLAFTLLVRFMHQHHADWQVAREALAGLLTGKPTRGVELWFFPCLLLTEITGACIYRIPSKVVFYGLSLGALCLGWISSPWHSQIPWNLDVALVALPFWFAGVGCRQLLSSGSGTMRNPTVLIWVLPLLLLMWTAFPGTRGSVDMRSATYGVPYVFYAIAFAGIAASCALAAALKHAPGIQRIGMDSFLIYPSHGLLFIVFAVAQYFILGTPDASKERSIQADLVYSAGAVLAVTLARPRLEKSRIAMFLLAGKLPSRTARMERTDTVSSRATVSG